MQQNWIGKSEGAEFSLKIDGTDLSFNVFTTRPDTLFGMTFAVLSPEHQLISEIFSFHQIKLKFKIILIMLKRNLILKECHLQKKKQELIQVFLL